MENLLLKIRFLVMEKIRDDRGIGVVEVILILLVLVGLVLIFKEQIVSLANSIFSSITSQANSV